MDIYFDTRNEREASQLHPMARISTPSVPSFNVYSVQSYNRHGFAWKASLRTTIWSIGPELSRVSQNTTHDCYRKALRIAFLRAYERNHGCRGQLLESSIATLFQFGVVGATEKALLHQIPTGVIIEAQGFVIGSHYYAVEKIAPL